LNAGATPEAAADASGTLEIQLAPTPGLEPKPRRTALRVAG
jgi:hypothetical protein